MRNRVSAWGYGPKGLYVFLILLACACSGSDDSSGTGGMAGNHNDGAVTGSGGSQSPDGSADGRHDDGAATGSGGSPIADGSAEGDRTGDGAAIGNDGQIADGRTDAADAPQPGSACRPGDTCGGPPLGCDYGVGLQGTCRHCGDASEVCCNSTGLTTGTCNGGLLCRPAVDTARHCSAEPSD